MNAFTKIQDKLQQSGTRGLMASVLRTAASRVDSYPNDVLSQQMSAHLNHQQSAHRVLSRYTSFNGKAVLEIGGAQSCDSAHPFLQDGAERVVVTGLDHITSEEQGLVPGLSVMRADALNLSAIFEPNSFDIVYGLSVLEHIPSPSLFISEVARVLKTGGICYLEGSPLWSSPKGHHIWVSTANGPTPANYFFSAWPGFESTNPLPDWSHLLMSDVQMQEYLLANSIPQGDIPTIVDWVYSGNNINRLSFHEIAKAYTGSELITLEAKTASVEVPIDIQATLRSKYGDLDYGVQGVSYVLTKT